MAAIWRGSGPLRRGDDRIAPGETFDPTAAERQSFGDLIESTADAADDVDAGTCQEITNNGDVCGRDRPCQYHD